MKFATAALSVLGEKLLVDSYPDGRVFCWLELLAPYDPKKTKIKISHDQKTIYLLFPTSFFTAEKLMKSSQQTENNLHWMILKNAVKKAKDEEIARLEEIAKDINIPAGYTAEPLFRLDYEVNRYFIDANGNRSKNVHCSKTSIRFWVKKSEARSCPAQETVGGGESMQVDTEDTKEKAAELNKASSELQAELKNSQDEAMMKAKKIKELEEQLSQLQAQLQDVNEEKEDILTKGGARLNELEELNVRLQVEAGEMAKVMEELKQTVTELRSQCKEQEETLENLEQEKDMMEVDASEQTTELNELIDKLKTDSKQNRNEAMLMENKAKQLEGELLKLHDKLQAVNHEKENLLAEGGAHLKELNERNICLVKEADENMKLIEGLKLSANMLEVQNKEQAEVMERLQQEKEKVVAEAKAQEEQTRKKAQRVFSVAKKAAEKQKHLKEAATTKLEAVARENTHLRMFKKVALEVQEKAQEIIEKEKRDQTLLSKFGKRHRSERPIDPERERIMDKVCPKYWANHSSTSVVSNPLSNNNVPVPDGVPSSNTQSSSCDAPVPDGAPSSTDVAQPPEAVQSSSSMDLN